MSKRLLMIALMLGMTAIHINFGWNMEAHAAIVKKVSKKSNAPAPAQLQSRIEETIPANLIDKRILDVPWKYDFSDQRNAVSRAFFVSNGKYLKIQFSFQGGNSHDCYDTIYAKTDNWEKYKICARYENDSVSAVNPSGVYLVAKDQQDMEKLNVFDLPSFNKLKELNFTKKISNVSFSRDSKYLFVVTSGLCSVIEVDKWETVEKIELPKGDSIGFSADGQYLMLSHGIYKIGTWEKLYTFGNGWYAFNENYLIHVNGKTLELIEIPSWRIINTFQANAFNEKYITDYDLSHDGKYLAIGTTDDWVDDCGMYIFSLESGNLLEKKKIGMVNDMYFHPDGFLIINKANNAYYKEYYNTVFFETGTWKQIDTLNKFKWQGIKGNVLLGIYNKDVITIDINNLIGYYKNKLLARLGFNDLSSKMSGELSVIQSDISKKLMIINNERDENIKLLGSEKKDEYETEVEYKNRIANLKFKKDTITNSYEAKQSSIRHDLASRRLKVFEQYDNEIDRRLISSRQSMHNLALSIGTYVAETEVYSISINAKGVDTYQGTVNVPRANARNFRDNYNKLKVSGEVQTMRTGRKKLENIVIYNPITGDSYYLAKTPSAQRQVASLPPTLSASIVFLEPSGDKALHAEETGKLIVKIKNSGQGSAYQLVTRLIPTKVITDLSYDTEKTIPEIGPGAEQEIIFPLKAGLDLPEMQAQYKIEFEEKNGLPPSPLKIQFQTRAILKPNLQVIDYVIDDANKDGMIQQEEVIKVTFRAQNKGQGIARNVKYNITLGNNVFQALNMPLENNLGDLKPNEVKQFVVAFYTNQKIKDKVPLTVNLAEERRRFNTEKQYAFSINVKEQTVFETVVAAKTQEVVKITDLESPSDLDQDIPRTGIVNKDAVAVVIGNYDYKNVQKVAFARRDAAAMKEYLVNVFGYDTGNVILLIDATYADMIDTLGSPGEIAKSKLRHYMRKDSEVFIYYTGHGAPGLRDKKGYLVPVDANPNNIETTGYSLESLYRNLESLNAPKLTVVIDACFSGDSQSGMLFKDASPIMVQAKTDKLQKGTLITSSSGDQISSWYPEKKHSLFTYYFLKGIREKVSNKEPVNLDNLKNYVSGEVDRMSKRLYSRIQTPGFDGNLKGDLIEFKTISPAAVIQAKP